MSSNHKTDFGPPPPDISQFLSFLKGLDLHERKTLNKNKDLTKIVGKYKTLSWRHLNFSYLCDLVLVKLSSDKVKTDRPMFVSILGGSKTGKSFLFNHLLKTSLAPSGAEKTTHSLLLYSHKRWSCEFLKQHYFSQPAFHPTPLKNPDSLCDSLTHKIYYRNHETPCLENIIFIDTPDFNREDDDNISLAYLALALSDIILYLITDDTYADAGGIVVAKLANESGKEIIPIYNMVDESLINDPERLARFFKEKLKLPYKGGDGHLYPPPYPFFKDRFWAVQWQSRKEAPDWFAKIVPVDFPFPEPCLENLEKWMLENRRDHLAQSFPLSLSKANQLLETLEPDLKVIIRQIDRIKADLKQISQSIEIEFPLAEAALAIYEIMEGFRPEAVNKFLNGVDKVHEMTVRAAIRLIKGWLDKGKLKSSGSSSHTNKRIKEESRQVTESVILFAESMSRFHQKFEFLAERLKLSDLEARRKELKKLAISELAKEDALAEVKKEMAEDMAKSPTTGILVYSEVSLRILAVAAAILLTGDGLINILWGTLGDMVGQPIARMIIGRMGGARVLERYKIRRRRSYQKIIEQNLLRETKQILEGLPGQEDLDNFRKFLTEMKTDIPYIK